MAEADAGKTSPPVKRVSYSVLDPIISPLVPKLYRVLPIPRRFPPEGIIAIGHLLAISGAVGFAFSHRYWWAGVLAACGVAGNHLADMVDGRHARETGQCRNGGELLDHFTDPLSFSYWMIGLGVAAGSLELSLAAVIVIYATAVLTNIKAKITGSFNLSWFGPTEFKALLTLFGLIMCGLVLAGQTTEMLRATAMWFLGTLVAVGVLQLVVGLYASVREVNASGKAPDASDWIQARHGQSADAAPRPDDAPPGGPDG